MVSFTYGILRDVFLLYDLIHGVPFMCVCVVYA